MSNRDIRQQWVEAFSNIGFSPDEVYNMPQAEFENSCSFILSSGLPSPFDAPNSTDKPTNNQRALPKRKSSARIISLQNHEFEQIQREMLEKEASQKLSAEKAEEARRKIETLLLENKQKLINSAKALDPEPANGVPIAIRFPSGATMIRKFDPDHLCDELFTFVEGQEEMFFDDNDTVPFTLQIAGQTLSKGKSFKDSGMAKRTFVTVIEEDIEEEDP